MGARGEAAGPSLESILTLFDDTQASTRTLTARFTERKEIGLLKDPVISEGRFFYTKPDDVLWEYTAPDPRYFLISKDELLSYIPGLKKAERVSIALYHDRLLKVLAIGQASSSLQKFYDIRLDDTRNRLPHTHLLILEPRKRMVRKRISEVRLWISRERALPVQMQYSEPDGDTTTIRFEDVRFNPDIASRVYRLEIPPDVEIKRGVSGFMDRKDGEKDQG